MWYLFSSFLPHASILMFSPLSLAFVFVKGLSQQYLLPSLDYTIPGEVRSCPHCCIVSGTAISWSSSDWVSLPQNLMMVEVTVLQLMRGSEEMCRG